MRLGVAMDAAPPGTPAAPEHLVALQAHDVAGAHEHREAPEPAGGEGDEFRYFPKEDLARSGLIRVVTPERMYRKPSVKTLVDFDACNRAPLQTGPERASHLLAAVARTLGGRRSRELTFTTLLLWQFATTEARQAGDLARMQQENAKLRLKMRNVVGFLSVRI